MKIVKTGGKACFEDLPLAVNWILTKKCNYRCSYCFHYGKDKVPPPQKQFSSLSQLKVAVDNIASLNRPWYDVTFGGGEPTIHPYIFDTIAMLHEKLGKRLNHVLIITNGSRNKDLYGRITDIAKSVNISMLISIHTDHVEMDHILELIENLSGDINLSFSLMFNPDKREFVHEIYDTMFEHRKKFWFRMNIITLRDGDRVDPRYTPEDFAWQKEAVKKFNELVKSVGSNFPPRRENNHPWNIIRDVEENGEIKTVPIRNRTLELAAGGLKFNGMYCIAQAALLRIEESGNCRGMVCSDDPILCNIFKENVLLSVRDKLIHAVRCKHNICGCDSNDKIPKFASEEDAKKYVEFAQKRQAELFDEYVATQAIKTI